MYLLESETGHGAPDPTVDTIVSRPSTPVLATDDDVGDDISANESSAADFESFDIPDPSEYPELEKIIVTDWDIRPPREGIMKWIEAVHRRSRGLELGALSANILSSVFREQSAKWQAIAKQYVSKVILLVHRFILSALQIVCADSQVVRNISSAIMGDICARYEASMAQVDLLIGVERDLTPYTLNHYFNDNQQKSYSRRMKNTLLPMAHRGADSEALWVDLNDILRATTNKSNTAYAREAIHDNLQAYYKVALKRLADNVFLQVVSYHLLLGPDSPHRLLSHQWALELDAETLRFVAGESRSTRDYRERLTTEIRDLGAAMKILR
ncbi:dynamin family protein [Colletotrichum sp. SAR 10_96]|nr:dynamin family protein [Colletotrichum sp. SAR 10_96]